MASVKKVVCPPLWVFDNYFSGGSVLEVFGTIPASIALSRTFGGRSLETVVQTADSWDLKNRRRLFLINKKFQGGLSTPEEVEFKALQEEHGAYLDAIQPPPTHVLEELEALVKQLEGQPSAVP